MSVGKLLAVKSFVIFKPYPDMMMFSSKIRWSVFDEHGWIWVLQPLGRRGVERAMHHERDVR